MIVARKERQYETFGPQKGPKINLAIMEREAREAREPQALQATQEQQEGQEQERQHQEAQQRKSGKSSPSINTASVHYRLGREHDEEQQSKRDQSINTASVYYRINRLCPCSPAARARRAVGAGSASVAPLGSKMAPEWLSGGLPGGSRQWRTLFFVKIAIFPRKHNGF